MVSENPRAFPLPHFEQGGRFFYQEGMTLRDWFAGQALSTCHLADEPAQAEWVAKRAYEFADAMLAARSHAPGDTRHD